MKRAATALAVVSLGCAHAASGSDRDTAYHQAVRSWTAEARIYKIADQRASFHATVESRVFRQQRAQERARELGWTADREQSEVAKDLDDEQHETSFILSAYTDVPRENDIGNARSIWRVALRTPGGELAPTVIDRLGRADENMEALYPYMDRYTRSYRVHFPKVTQGPVTLLIASGLGQAELTFENL